MKSAPKNEALELLKNQWWWLDPKRSTLNEIDQRENTAAKVWELLRRSKFYPHIWRTMAPKIDRQNAELFTWLLKVIGEYRYLLWYGCNPDLTWIELNAAQRKAVDPRRLFARIVPAANREPITVNVCEVRGTKDGVESIHECTNGHIQLHPKWKVLPKGQVRQRFLVFSFNPRTSEPALKKLMPDALKQCEKLQDCSAWWAPQPVKSRRTARQIKITPVPRPPPGLLSKKRDHEFCEDAAMLWVPVHHTSQMIRARFSSLIKRRAKWINSFAKLWGRESASKMFPMLNSKPAETKHFWLALSAFDAHAKQLLRKGNQVGDFIFNLLCCNSAGFTTVHLF